MAGTEFSTTLQGLRKEKKVTQEQLATYLGVSPQAVSKWENGSYPDGDLLPRIADYFEVSIDYLYGRAEKERPMEQKVLEYMQDALKKECEKGIQMSDMNEFWEKIYKLLWACQITPWSPNKDYYPRMRGDDDDSKSASVLMNNEGYSYINLDKRNEFCLLLRKSSHKDGYAHWLKDSDKVRELFGVLSSEENVKVLIYLYSLGWVEYANASTISAATGVAVEKVQKLLEYMVSDISEPQYWHYPLNKIKVATKSGEPEIAYGVDMNVAGLLFGLFTIADSFVHNPNGYNMQISNRTEPWVTKKDK